MVGYANEERQWIMRRQKLFGRDQTIVTKAVQMGRHFKAGAKFWGALGNCFDLFRKVHELVESELDFTAPRPTFPVWIEHTRDYPDLLRLARCHGDNLPAEYFRPEPALPAEQVLIELFQFHRGSMRENTLSTLDSLGYRPATVFETLSLLAAHPDAIWDLCQKYSIPMAHDKRYRDWKKLLVLGNMGKHSAAPTVHLADSDHPKWKDTWFGLRTDSSDLNAHVKNFFVPAVKKS